MFVKSLYKDIMYKVDFTTKYYLILCLWRINLEKNVVKAEYTKRYDQNDEM